MSLYSLSIFDRAGCVLDTRSLDAGTVSTALAQANRCLCTILDSDDRDAVDMKGRVDVLDQQGWPVARIYCAEALAARS